tara:strand:- start:690 stop:1406 length:717 start_codon:yes stop_codon:yes gene_type:complete
MKLAIDIGNTSITCGIFKKNIIIERFNIQSLKSLNKYIDSKNIKKIIISSVVPKLTEQYLNYLKNKNYIIHLITYKSGNLVLRVEDPKTVGCDRICNIFAAIKLYKSPAIIIDFGTATTYDVINTNNEFIGGAIGAGIETSADYLINKAALLSKTNLKFPNHAIGINTTENIQSGIMFGAIDQVQGMIARIKNQNNDNYQIILTGGFSKLLSPYLSIKHILDIDLTLKGLYYIDESNT